LYFFKVIKTTTGGYNNKISYVSTNVLKNSLAYPQALYITFQKIAALQNHNGKKNFVFPFVPALKYRGELPTGDSNCFSKS
jgi:hypothetical protein